MKGVVFTGRIIIYKILLVFGLSRFKAAKVRERAAR
jgi:hypothetical protein